MEELGGLIINENGKIEAIGKKVNKNNIPSREKFVDLKEKYIFPGLIDMRVFVGEPGFEYKENYRSLSEAALAGGVTSVVTMPNTKPVIDSVSIVDFCLIRFEYVLIVSLLLLLPIWAPLEPHRGPRCPHPNRKSFYYYYYDYNYWDLQGHYSEGFPGFKNNLC